jgi:catechol 2,3-dioxygenase-like lactoylglutathione lyase family enzyme
MLNDINAVANIAVKDLAAARRFYEGVLGLAPVGEHGGEVVVYRSGESTLNVYRSDFAGTNKATAVTWSVPNVTTVVNSLKAKGVRFEHYDLPGLVRDGDLHRAAGMTVAWFKDPDGNILNIAGEG